jgi:uncharacterized cupin superfamily protein
MSDTFHRFLPDGHPETGMGPSDLAATDAFTTDDHTETIHTFFETADGSVTSGVWECAPCLEEIDAYPVHELMTVLSGSLNLTDAHGKKDTFTAGDTFLIPKGARVTWEITETFRKFYMIVE